MFAPLCKYEEAECDDEMEVKPGEDYIIYENNNVRWRVSKKKYMEYDTFLPNPDLAKNIDFEELALRWAFKQALQFFANRSGLRYFRVFTTDDIKFVNPHKNKWYLGKNLPEYTGLYDMSGECFCSTP